MELVTGVGGTDHVGSEDFGAYNAYTYGKDTYVLSGCDTEVIDANTVRVKAGELLAQGRHIRIRGYEDLPIQSGSSGRNRVDLVVIRYTKDASGIEDAPLVVIPGAPVTGTPSEPSYVQGSILAGDLQVDIPVFKVSVSGISAPTVTRLIPKRGSMIEEVDKKSNSGHTHPASDIASGTLPASRGGTGQTSLQATRNAMGLGNTTGALPIANGGTGATTSAAAYKNITGQTKDFDTENNIDTWVPVFASSKIQHRDIPTQYNSDHWDFVSVPCGDGSIGVFRRGGYVFISLNDVMTYGPTQGSPVYSTYLPSGYRPSRKVHVDGVFVETNGCISWQENDLKSYYPSISYALVS